MDHFFDLQVFCQIVDSGSMAQAARTLGLAPATVTGMLSRMEKKLGVRLLDRTTRRISVTEAGRLWYEHAKRIIEQSVDAENAVRNLAAEPRGALRVTLPLGVAMHFIYPHLQEFSTRYPRIQLDLQVLDRIVDLVEHRFDLALRAGHAQDSELICRSLLPYRRITCASPKYLAAHGVPQHPSDLSGHQCLQYRHDPHPSLWEFCIDGAVANIPVRGSFSSNESHALLAWARGGLGITRQPEWLVADDLKNGSLVSILDRHAVTKPSELPSIYAVFPKTRHRPKKVDAFIQFFGARMR